MILSQFESLKPYEAEVYAFDSCQPIITEAGYGRRYKFPYANWKHDPRPDVLVLGWFKHHSTGNKLLGGINLHYLSDDQIEGLRKWLPRIIKRGNLKNRYRYGKRYLPDVFENYYRTYNQDHIHMVTPDTLRFWHPKADKRRDAQEKRRKEMEAERERQIKIQKDLAAQKEKERLKDAEPEIQEPDREIDQLHGASRHDWERKERVDRRLKSGVKKSKHPEEIATTRRRSELEAGEQEKDAELTRQSDEEDEEDEDRPDEVQDLLDMEGIVRSSEFGLLWKTPEDYVKWHSPYKFVGYCEPIRTSLCESHKGKLRAIIDLRDGKTIIDKCEHIKMLSSAGWDFNHTVRLEMNGDDLVAHHDNDDHKVIEHLFRDFAASDTCKYLCELG